ncbi:hypothetical protein SDC9_179023 [bioreactor metagenome]|uniref:Uncharacterized protein n=1 Tax=bioreactor metagenome TaxID=1076179 RepID=A0A645H0P1_9ZZZZ
MGLIKVEHLATQPLQELRLVGRVGGQADHGHLFPPVEHAVAGGAVAHAGAQQLGLSRILGPAGYAGGQNHRPGLGHVGADAEIEGRPHGHDAQHLSGTDFGARLLRVGQKGLQHFAAGHARHAQVVIHPLGLVKCALLRGICNHQHGFVSGSGVDGGAQSRRSAAHHRDVVHGFPLLSVVFL